MKKISIITTLFAASLIFTACGGGGGSTSTAGTGTSTVSTTETGTSTSVSTGGTTLGDQEDPAQVQIVPLNIGEVTPIEAGYSIVDSDDDAVLEILVSGETRTVILKSGMASIKMPI